MFANSFLCDISSHVTFKWSRTSLKLVRLEFRKILSANIKSPLPLELSIPINMASDSGLHSLSSRGQTAAKSTLPVFADIINDLYSADSNPSGIISLGLAENVRMSNGIESCILRHIWLD